MTGALVVIAAFLVLPGQSGHRAEALLSKGYELLDEGDAKAAIVSLRKAYAKARSKRDEDAEMRGIVAKYLGRALRALGQVRKAIPYLKEAAEGLLDHEAMADLATARGDKRTCELHVEPLKTLRGVRYKSWLALASTWVKKDEIEDSLDPDEMPQSAKEARRWLCKGCKQGEPAYPIVLQGDGQGLVGVAMEANDGSVTGFGPLEHTSGGRCVLVGAKVVLVGATEQRVVVKVTRTDGEMYESSESDPGAMGTACLSDKVTTRFLVLPRTLSKEPVQQIRHVLSLPAPGVVDDLPNTVFPELGTLTSLSKKLRVKACGKTLSLPL